MPNRSSSSHQLTVLSTIFSDSGVFLVRFYGGCSPDVVGECQCCIVLYVPEWQRILVMAISATKGRIAKLGE